LADANEAHDWRIYADFAMVLIDRARHLYSSDPFGAEVEQVAYALDSTTIDLCLSMFPWAQFRKTKGAVKMHTLIDLRGNIPTFIRISTGKVHDVNILDELVAEPGAFYIMDRGYVDFERLYRLTKKAAFFVTRTKDNIQLQRRYSHPVDAATNVRSDQTVVAATAESWMHYPTPLRRIRFYDEKRQRFLTFLTNNFDLPALTIANLYRCRWQVELFFKWIKQHLRIKAFYGTSLNAVSTQIWIGITIYLLLAIVKKELALEASLYQILQVASVSIFDKTPILRAFQPEDNQDDFEAFSKQLKLFDL
jgi:transposase